MKNITDEAVLAVYAQIKHMNHLEEICSLKKAKAFYLNSACAMWDTLHVISGNESLVQTIDEVHHLINSKAAA